MDALKVVACLSTVIAVSGIAVTPSRAETVTIACEANPAFNAPEMTIVYDGDDEGTLTITAPFGEMALPATKEYREGTDETGQKLSATGIRASGPATVLMPDKVAIESCAKGKLPPDQLADSDIVFVTVMGCVQEVPIGDAPIEIQASAEIALTGEADVYVGVTRTYAEPTELAVGTIKLEAYPSCTLKE
jgi:hypothetical protein